MAENAERGIAISSDSTVEAANVPGNVFLGMFVDPEGNVLKHDILLADDEASALGMFGTFPGYYSAVLSLGTVIMAPSGAPDARTGTTNGEGHRTPVDGVRVGDLSKLQETVDWKREEGIRQHELAEERDRLFDERVAERQRLMEERAEQEAEAAAAAEADADAPAETVSTEPAPALATAAAPRTTSPRTTSSAPTTTSSETPPTPPTP